jgi:hypothetical protein
MIGSAYNTLYTSSDYGVTWTAGPTASNYWLQVGIDFSGRYQVATAYTEGIFYSMDYGASWASSPVGASTNPGVAISANGQYILTADNGGYIYTSSVPTLFPAGLSTTTVTAATVAATTVVAETVVAEYVAASRDVTVDGHVFSQETSQIVDYNFTNFAQQWTSVVTSPAYRGGAISATGKYQIIVIDPTGVLLSSNYGKTFAAAGPVKRINQPAISASGQYIYVGDTGLQPDNSRQRGSLYSSSNYGASFTPLSSAITTSWNSVACSANGRYVLGGSGDNVYFSLLQLSRDYGATWTSLLNGNNWSVGMSATGQHMLAGPTSYGSSGNPGAGLLQVSSDFGVTWNPVGISSDWLPVAVSGSGKYMTALATVGTTGVQNIYRSEDYGANWTLATAAGVVLQIQIDYSGQYQVAAVVGNRMFYSIDYGVTWNFVSVGSDSRGVGISANAQYLLIGDNGAQRTYTSSVPTQFPTLFASTIGINCNAPAYTLDVNGLAHQSNNSASWYVASDRRIKTDIVPADLSRCMASLQSLPLRMFQYDSNRIPGRRDSVRRDSVLGLIAQEVQPLFPDAISVTSNYGISDLLGLDYDAIYKAHIGATQYLGRMVETQSTQIAALLSQVSTLSQH